MNVQRCAGKRVRGPKSLKTAAIAAALQMVVFSERVRRSEIRRPVPAAPELEGKFLCPEKQQPPLSLFVVVVAEKATGTSLLPPPVLLVNK